MRCPKQPLPGGVSQTQLLPQQPAGSGVFPGWPPYLPQPAFNPWLGSHYPVAPGVMPPPSQLPPQIPGPGEPSVWFEGLVTAVSKKIKDDEKKAVTEDVNKNAAPANLSIESEKALVSALRKQKEGKLTMEQVFRELSQKHGHTELAWKTWFFANYERLISQVDSNPAVERASADELGESTRFITPVAARTRSAYTNWSSRSPTVTVANTLSRSRKELEFELDSKSEDSGSEWEEMELDEEGSTSDDSESNGWFPTRDAPQLGSRTTGKINNTQIEEEEEPALGLRRQEAPITDEDLRAMALYRVEKGDGPEIRRYSAPSQWREFAQRPENCKRSLAAWGCVPRNPRHAAAIDRYVREYQLCGADSEMVGCKPTPPILTPQVVLSFGSGTASSGSENAARLSTRKAMDRMDIIDLTCEEEK